MQKQKPLKLCRDCKHVKPQLHLFGLIKEYEGSRCKHPKLVTHDKVLLVTGEIKLEYSLCTFLRMDFKTTCGSEAKYFESKT